jgi:hypothetical protein
MGDDMMMFELTSDEMDEVVGGAAAAAATTTGNVAFAGATDSATVSALFVISGAFVVDTDGPAGVGFAF